MGIPKKIKLFFILTIGFILFLIISTVTHELGHYFISKKFHNNPVLHYKSTSNIVGNKIIPIQDSLRFVKGLSELKKQDLRNRITRYRKEKVLTKFGGPLINILFGTLGFVCLLLFKSKKHFGLSRWFLMFTTLYWARQIVVFPMSIFFYLKNGKVPSGDEEYISEYFSFPFFSMGLILFLVAALIITFSFLKHFNKSERRYWFFSGLVGGTIGIILWFVILGPRIL